MQIGIVGLGRMGGNIARRLQRGGHAPVVFDRSSEATEALAAEDMAPAAGLADMVAKLARPRAVWLMLPEGDVTETAVAELGELLDPDDVVIDGGNTFWKHDIRRAATLREKGIHYMDVGTSGGVWGLERGYCLMVGGDTAIFARLEPIFETLAPGYGEVARTSTRKLADDRAARGYIHAGPAGAGHFVKMVHNGIEYGLMQAYAEGFDILYRRGSADLPENERYDFEVADIAEVWRRGSVVSSWLLDLTAEALGGDGRLEGFRGAVPDSGEGRWTIEAAIQEAVPTPVLAASLFARFRSRDEHTFADRLLSAMRFGFGGHIERPK
ncbi:phosphogluconate dehydrogenase (NAD(+)-dependent, decarboxylating) [Methylobrevis albus]|uniref:Decarboxylating 6-phosphogluconate dehydrogenase n=1 Tax=Methylobrevis albus TaxID=2793297 RepID=A0A931I2P9_9HYPH|nr:decarboxylating 6-phosphogluconate dehydrogenase [Methylobrevis albus]MBH0239145.1 decarboxylating 6-phosphogluconate dehydrogenase [Methylobrevis albus]